MFVEWGLEHLGRRSPTGLTIGAFDGVHLGHQALVRWLVAGAHSAGLQAVVFTFEPLPRVVLEQGENGLLSTLEERLTFLEPLGIDGVVVLPFDRQVAATPAVEFVALLVERLALRGLWVGPDFSLGRGREGKVPVLRGMGTRQGFDVHVFEETVRWQGEPVRSSRIRQALKTGDLVDANGCLGRPYRLSGVVMHGDRRGRALGFPTANLEIPERRLLPADGVYVCRAHLNRGHFDAITNVGTRPTFDHRPPTVEAYLLDFAADIYEEPMQVDFLHRLRPEVKFPSAAALVDQMRRDEADARGWLENRRGAV